MLNAYIIIGVTLLVAANGLKCNKCFYAGGFRDGQEHTGFKFDRSCNWEQDVKRAYGGVECAKISNVDPVCLVWRLKAGSINLILRSCYNQNGGVRERDLDKCSKKDFADFFGGTLNSEIQRFIMEFLSSTKNQTLVQPKLPTDLCLCNKEDNCNSGRFIEDNASTTVRDSGSTTPKDNDRTTVKDGGAYAITSNLLVIAAIPSLLCVLL